MLVVRGRYNRYGHTSPISSLQVSVNWSVSRFGASSVTVQWLGFGAKHISLSKLDMQLPAVEGSAFSRQ